MKEKLENAIIKEQNAFSVLRKLYQEQLGLLSRIKKAESDFNTENLEVRRLQKEISDNEIDVQRCICGHIRKAHGPSRSINYTEGLCLAHNCKCEHFILTT